MATTARLESTMPTSTSQDAGLFSSSCRLNGTSIRQRLYHRPRSRIVVEPLLWTEQHLDLLGCEFIGPSPAPDVSMKLKYSGDARRFGKFMNYFTEPPEGGSRLAGMRVLMGGTEVPLLTSGFCLQLRFGDYRGVELPCTSFCLRSEGTGDSAPRYPTQIFAHVDQEFITYLRKDRIRSSGRSTGRFNQPRCKIISTRLKKLVPKEPLCDPYLVAVLLALAQQQWWTLDPASTKRALGVRPKLLYTTVGPDGDEVYLYSTTVSSTFLKMLDDETFVPPTPQSLSIRISAIPFEPSNTLRDRLNALILESTSLEAIGNSRDLVAYPPNLVNSESE